jgi:tRNA G18 (ribose-2'-O)-methylase SpoU
VRDAGDPAVALYGILPGSDLLRADERVFVAEGEVVVRVLATRSRFRPRSLFVEERRLESLEDVLAALGDEVPVYVAPQGVMDRVVGFPIHRGVLALGDRGDPAPPDAVLAGGDLVVGIVGVTNHDNVGGIFRNAAAFGASAVLFDRTTCDPLYRKAIRVSVGGVLVVPFARCETADTMLDALARGGFALHALTPGGDEPIEALREPGRRAILVGAEGGGLPEDVLRRARRGAFVEPGGDESIEVGWAGHAGPPVSGPGRGR